MKPIYLFSPLLVASFVFGDITVTDVRNLAIQAGETLYQYETNGSDVANLTQLIANIKHRKPEVAELHHSLRLEVADEAVFNLSGPYLVQYDLNTVALSEAMMEEFASRALCYLEGGMCAERVHYAGSAELTALAAKNQSKAILDLCIETETQIEIVIKQKAPDQALMSQIIQNCDQVIRMAKEALTEAEPIVKEVKDRLMAGGDLRLRPANRIWVEVEMPWYAYVAFNTDAYEQIVLATLKN